MLTSSLLHNFLLQIIFIFTKIYICQCKYYVLVLLDRHVHQNDTKFSLYIHIDMNCYSYENATFALSQEKRTENEVTLQKWEKELFQTKVVDRAYEKLLIFYIFVIKYFLNFFQDNLFIDNNNYFYFLKCSGTV